jgi:hypothetical protein
MLPDAVKKQAGAIRKSLSSQGWAVVEVEQPFENECWAAEIWRIESEWSPQGVHAFVTFLVDPMGARDDVWAVAASRERLTGGTGNIGPMMRLMKEWQEELPMLVKGLSRFRVEATETAQ